jgi:hypothetical protein
LAGTANAACFADHAALVTVVWSGLIVRAAAEGSREEPLLDRLGDLLHNRNGLQHTHQQR